MYDLWLWDGPPGSVIKIQDRDGGSTQRWVWEREIENRDDQVLQSFHVANMDGSPVGVKPEGEGISS